MIDRPVEAYGINAFAGHLRMQRRVLHSCFLWASDTLWNVLRLRIQVSPARVCAKIWPRGLKV